MQLIHEHLFRLVLLLAGLIVPIILSNAGVN